MMDLAVPSLRRVCVLKIVEEIGRFCPGVPFEDLGKYQFIVGPFECISSHCIEAIFEYVASTRQLNPSWLSLLLTTHLRGVDLSSFPSSINPVLFRMLLYRCKRLERLIIPNCKKIPNKTLCEALRQNPSLLHVDISNKLSPKVDASVVDTLARSCRHLTVLKLSDHRLEDPKSLLVLCGRVAVAPPANNADLAEREERVARGITTSAPTSEPVVLLHTNNEDQMVPTWCDHSGVEPPNAADGASDVSVTEKDGLPATSTQLSEISEELHVSVSPVGKPAVNELTYREARALIKHRQYNILDSPTPLNGGVNDAAQHRGTPHVPIESEEDYSIARNLCEFDEAACYQESKEAGVGYKRQNSEEKPLEMGTANGASATREERENEQRGVNPNVENSDESATDDDNDDLYEKDEPISPLTTEDHSWEFGCFELETLWLDNVNMTDQVAAVLMQHLPRLRNLNVSDTDICNPWRLLDPSRSVHLKYLCHLDVKSTALSRTALEMIPKFHPDLQKLSISTTMLPPHTYANIGRLTGVADLELIGGQFYPCAPEEIFRHGIAPAVCAIGKHLCSLNLTYFAHVEFEVIALNCPRIERLDLSFTSISVTYPCLSLEKCCPHLTSLNLAYCHVDAREPRRSEVDDPPSVAEDKALEKMIGQSPNIEELFLCGLGIQDDTLNGIFPGLVHPLRSLNVSRCKQITIAGVRHVWERCPHIQTVDMTYCKAITLADYQRFEKKSFEERPRFKVEGKIDWK